MNSWRWRSIFSRKLCYKMEDKGVNRTELANLIGVNKSTISRYCNGEIVPNAYDLTLIASALECTVDELVSTEDWK